MLVRALIVLLLACGGAWSQLVQSAAPPVIVVHLRQPRAGDPTEGREDPFWEAGSFGITGCHGRNLLHPDNAAALQGARLAFAQGGDQGFKLVYLTPPVTAVRRGGRVEANWEPGRPFKYAEAPLLIDMRGR